MTKSLMARQITFVTRPSVYLRKERDMDIPTMNKKKGMTKSANVTLSLHAEGRQCKSSTCRNVRST